MHARPRARPRDYPGVEAVDVETGASAAGGHDDNDDDDDSEAGVMRPDKEPKQYAAMLRFFRHLLSTRTNFELCEAYLHLFLTVSSKAVLLSQTDKHADRQSEILSSLIHSLTHFFHSFTPFIARITLVSGTHG